MKNANTDLATLNTNKADGLLIALLLECRNRIEQRKKDGPLSPEDLKQQKEYDSKLAELAGLSSDALDGDPDGADSDSSGKVTEKGSAIESEKTSSAATEEQISEEEKSFRVRLSSAIEDLNARGRSINDAAYARRLNVYDTGCSGSDHSYRANQRARENGRVQNNAWRLSGVYRKIADRILSMKNTAELWTWMTDELSFLDCDGSCYIPKEKGGGYNWFALRSYMEEQTKQSYQDTNSRNGKQARRYDEFDDANYAALRIVYSKFWRIVPERELQ